MKWKIINDSLMQGNSHHLGERPSVTVYMLTRVSSSF